jgi:FeS assembly SUF system regulator
MLRLSKLADYATVILSHIAANDRPVHTAVDLASTTGIALPTVSKILKTLANAHILLSIRGAKGGYRLARSPNAISVAAIIGALDGPIALTECSLSRQHCEQAAGCNIKTNWNLINHAIDSALDSVTLADLVKPAAPLPEFRVSVETLRR